MAIADGTYELLCALDVTMALDVTGNSAANKANVRIWGRNGSNGQKWSVATVGGVTTITDAETGKSLDVAGATQASGTNVWMYTANGSTAQQWTLTEDGTENVNGTAYKAATIGAFAGTTYVLDVAGGKTELGTNVQIWAANSTDAQRFVLVPTEWYATASKSSYSALPTPANGGAGTTQGTDLGTVVEVSSGTLLPCWECPETAYQVRYRTRTRKSGEDWFGDWTDWKSISDSSTSWDGWGAVGTSNCTPTLVDGVQWSASGVAVDNSTTYDRTDVELGVRPWRSSWGASASPAHGDTYAYALTTVRKVTLSTLDLTLVPTGMYVTWVTDLTRDGNAVTVACDAWGTYSGTGDGSDYLEVPMSAVTDLPEVGDSLDVTLTIVTEDGLTFEHMATCTVAYEGSHGTALTLASVVSGTIATVTASDPDAVAWLVIEEGHGTRFVALDGSSPWTVAPPLNQSWQVLACTGDDSTWASKLATFSAITDAGYHVTSQDGTKDLGIYVGAGEPPSFEHSYSRSVESFEVEGRERPVHVAGSSTKATWTVEGAAYGSGMASDVALADWAVHAGHVVFRSPTGFWSQACVTGGSVDMSAPRHRVISLSLAGEVW